MNILITGGASGLGEAITKKMASNIDNKVYYTYNTSIEKTIKIKELHQNTIAIKCDFSKREEFDSLIQQMETMNLDILVNNAYSGEAIKTYFHKIPLIDFKTDFENNILPTIAITQKAISIFKKKKNGKIITILTSFLTDSPPIGASVYVANKAYLLSLVKSWAKENSMYNITSNSISPSFMTTNFTKNVDERVIEQIANSNPLKKLLTVEEVADVAYFFANSTQQINGLDFLMNAGINVK